MESIERQLRLLSPEALRRLADRHPSFEADIESELVRRAEADHGEATNEDCVTSGASSTSSAG